MFLLFRVLLCRNTEQAIASAHKNSGVSKVAIILLAVIFNVRIDLSTLPFDSGQYGSGVSCTIPFSARNDSKVV